jgi:DNA-binding winged helix-turn-helix (wHTH) protein
MLEGTLCFGRFRLDLARREVLAGERSLRVGDRAFQILCLLAQANGALVSKDELGGGERRGKQSASSDLEPAQGA